jgi:uncharacterized protein
LRICYLDASAIVKLATAEPESSALRAWLSERSPLVTSRVSTVEVLRAVGRKDPAGLGRVRVAVEHAFSAIAVAELDADVAARAAELPPPTLRALDAIHLATALAVRDELEAVVTYDTRLADAARAAGLGAIAPA